MKNSKYLLIRFAAIVLVIAFAGYQAIASTTRRGEGDMNP